jgi:hypothetical protein
MKAMTRVALVMVTLLFASACADGGEEPGLAGYYQTLSISYDGEGCTMPKETTGTKRFQVIIDERRFLGISICNDSGPLACDYFGDAEPDIFAGAIFREFMGDGAHPADSWGEWESEGTCKFRNVRGTFWDEEGGRIRYRLENWMLEQPSTIECSYEAARAAIDQLSCVESIEVAAIRI